MKLSANDRRLLASLQKDITRSQVDIANDAGMSRTSCWRRVREFENAGLIQGKVALLDPKLAGFNLQALLLVTMTEHSDENRRSFEAKVAALTEVTECFSVSGDRDYVLFVVMKDMDAYSDFLNEQILKHPAVRSASSTFVLKRVKYTTKLPV